MLSRPRQRGSVLVLMPVAVLVMLILGAIVVDCALVELRRRELHAAAAGAANDAATAALAPEELRAGRLVIDPERAARVVAEALAARGGPAVDRMSIAVADDGRRVTVTLEGSRAAVFAGAVPGAPDRFHLRASATALVVAADP